MRKFWGLLFALLVVGEGLAQGGGVAPLARSFHDAKYPLSLEVPAGWTITTKDREVSTFRLDARSAPASSRMRMVATIASNPFTASTFSGALLYFSVAPAKNDAACGSRSSDGSKEIGGQNFRKVHEEQSGRVCTESRDDVYVAYRKNGCYRFDLVTNTFCAQVSGAKDMTSAEMDEIRRQMEAILGTVRFR